MSEAPENSSSPEDPARASWLSRPQPLFAVGDTVPGLSSWLLERRLGGGGFGEVWLAKHEFTDERRAVKFCTDPVARNRLVKHEKTVVARVMKHARSHPNIVPLLEHNLDGEIPWLMYEFVEGGTLADVIDSWKPLSAEERVRRAVRTLHALAAALATVHQLTPPIVHRDLKPQNVLMAGDTPRITDFGIGGAAVGAAVSESKTRDSAALPSFLRGSASLKYASPEQAFGSSPDPRDDVYSLGVIAYEMLVPDTKYSPGADAHVDLVEREVPADLISLVVKSIARNAERRPKDAREWETALAALAPDKLVPAAPKAPGRKGGDVVEFPLPHGLKILFCWIPPGECQLGSSPAEQDAVAEQLGGERRDWLADESEAQRGVFAASGFWLAKYPVTQAEWYQVMGNTPSHFQAGGRGASKVKGLDTTRFPVEQVSWDMICGEGGFLDRLNALGGIEKAFGGPGAFALPHEDTWEYACRGGFTDGRPFYWGREINGTQANIDGRHPFGTTAKGPFLGRPTPVGRYEKTVPHPWGLCDLHGNVWEWCENLSHQAPDRALRGGSWFLYGHYGRAAYRSSAAPNSLAYDIGFRLCLPGPL